MGLITDFIADSFLGSINWFLLLGIVFLAVSLYLAIFPPLFFTGPQGRALGRRAVASLGLIGVAFLVIELARISFELIRENAVLIAVAGGLAVIGLIIINESRRSLSEQQGA